jgi:hypothetical protein
MKVALLSPEALERNGQGTAFDLGHYRRALARILTGYWSL